MPLDPEFIADCAYGPGAILIDEILEIDADDSRVVVRMPTHADLPITREQRVHPIRHPRHVSGGLMVHMTGVVGMVHAYYVLGLRHRDGWVGYGGKINEARFHGIAPPGEPLVLMGKATRVRRSPKRIFARYTLEFTQAGRKIYSGDQIAMWLKVESEADIPVDL